MVTGPSVWSVARCPTSHTKDRLKKALSSQKIYVPSVYRLLSSGAEQLAPHVTRDEIIMMRASSGARRLYAISTRPASTAAGAIFKDSLSFSTELSLHRRRSARGSEVTGRVGSHGSTSKMANGRFTVVRPWYELYTLSMRTLGYTLGRSGSARRTSLGFLAVPTLYCHFG